ncbi:MAG TPA: hypothetical protein VK936_08370, partial [Longimicrobiales bacterium]|nr:hypothetical protein [Longimicrobiales bacterium]
MSSPARSWLAARSAGVPASLQTRMETALLEAPAPAGSPVHAELAAAAIACLQAALRIGDDRSAAIHLLAADALITAACEAAADDGLGGVDELMAACAPSRLDALVAEIAPAHPIHGEGDAAE